MGFDRNDYPGDQNLPALRQTFSFVGYWLNNPPGETSNNWAGKRQNLDSAGFGFLVLFNGRLDAGIEISCEGAESRNSRWAVRRFVGQSGRISRSNGYFLDQEEGGRMLPEQKAYIYAWVDAVAMSGFHAGIYCSGIAAKDDQNIVTADDIRHHAGGRALSIL